MDGRGHNSSWFLEEVTVKASNHPRTTYLFQVGQWFGKHTRDRLVERDLEPTRVIRAPKGSLSTSLLLLVLFEFFLLSFLFIQVVFIQIDQIHLVNVFVFFLFFFVFVCSFLYLFVFFCNCLFFSVIVFFFCTFFMCSCFSVVVYVYSHMFVSLLFCPHYKNRFNCLMLHKISFRYLKIQLTFI